MLSAKTIHVAFVSVAVLLSIACIASGCNNVDTSTRDDSVSTLAPTPCDPSDGDCGGGGGTPTVSYVGATDCTPSGDDCNMCVNDVPTAFEQIRDHGEVLGFRTDGFNLNVRYALGSPHLQGIQRLRSGDGRYFVVTKSDDRGSDSETSFVVEMGSRNSSGARFRSNRLSSSIDEPEHTVSPGSDRVVGLNDTPFDPSHHAGGAQALGSIVAIPVEGGGADARVYLYNYRLPRNPQIVSFVPMVTHEAGAAALTKLSDGRYLLAVGRRDSDEIDFFRSSSPDLYKNTDWIYIGFKNMTGHDGIDEWKSYQTLNFLTDCNGRLYMLGTDRAGRFYTDETALGIDYMDLYFVEDDQGYTLPKITLIESKYMYCSN